MTVVVVASNKGGAGKSTTAATIAFGLAERDPTLLIDLDPQGHAALLLGVEPRPGIFDWLVSGTYPAPIIQPRSHRPNLHLIPGDSRTKTVDMVYRAEVNGTKQLISQLHREAEHFRWVVIDTASGGLLQEAALAAAGIVVVPFRPEMLGVDGVYGALALIERLNANAHIIVVPTAYAKRLNDHRADVAEVASLASQEITVLPPIPARSAVNKAVKAGLTIWEHNDRALHEVARGYSLVVEAIRTIHLGEAHAQTI